MDQDPRVVDVDRAVAGRVLAAGIPAATLIAATALFLGLGDSYPFDSGPSAWRHTFPLVTTGCLASVGLVVLVARLLLGNEINGQSDGGRPDLLGSAALGLGTSFVLAAGWLGTADASSGDWDLLPWLWWVVAGFAVVADVVLMMGRRPAIGVGLTSARPQASWPCSPSPLSPTSSNPGSSFSAVHLKTGRSCAALGHGEASWQHAGPSQP